MGSIKCKNMYSMFTDCNMFNQPLNSWDVSKVKNMYSMFAECDNFNHSLDSWHISDFNRKLMFLPYETVTI